MAFSPDKIKPNVHSENSTCCCPDEKNAHLNVFQHFPYVFNNVFSWRIAFGYLTLVIRIYFIWNENQYQIINLVAWECKFWMVCPLNDPLKQFALHQTFQKPWWGITFKAHLNAILKTSKPNKKNNDLYTLIHSFVAMSPTIHEKYLHKKE